MSKELLKLEKSIDDYSHSAKPNDKVLEQIEKNRDKVLANYPEEKGRVNCLMGKLYRLSIKKIIDDYSHYAKPNDKVLEQIEKYRDKALATHPEEKGRVNYLLGTLYWLPGKLNNDKIACEYFRKAIKELPDSDNYKPVAYYNMGLSFYTKRRSGDGEIIQNFDSAYVYFHRAQEYNKRWAIALAEMTEFGLGVKKDPAYALTLYEEVNSAGGDAYAKSEALRYALERIENGNLDVLAYDKYQMYIIKYSVEADEDEALKYLRESASAGYLPALHDLGTLMCKDEKKYNRDEGLKYLKQAADANYMNSMHNYAYYCSEEKIPYRQKAAEMGFAPSQYAMGVDLKKESVEDAYKWFFVAAKQGYQLAKFQVKELESQIPVDRKEYLEHALDNLPSTKTLSAKILANFSKIPMFEGKKFSSMAEKEAMIGKNEAKVNEALNITFYQSQYNKYGRRVASALKDENVSEEYIKSLQQAMKNIVHRAEERGFFLQRNEMENMVIEKNS